MATQEITTTETVETITTTTIRTIEDVIMPPELVIIEQQVYCTSLQIAKHFEKEHKNVIRDIEHAILIVKAVNNPDMQADQMFVKGFDEAPNNLGFKVKRPIYHLNVDGFSFLAMSYTTEKAAKFKLAYMAAFKKMQAMLLSLNGITEKPVKYLSTAQTQVLKQRVERLVTPIWIQQSYINTIWNRLRFVANADNQNTIPADQYDALMEELDRMEHTMTGDHGGYKLLEEFHDYLYRQILCLGTPLSMTVRKNWFAKFGSLLPKNISWRKAALMLEEAA